MKAKTTNNKASAKKKLIPAAGSLLISAAMLSTSTFAWFTMSKEVDVTGIKMTASVPEDIQISLGHGTTKGLKVSQEENAGAATFAEANDTRTLTVADPVVDGATTDWTNTVDISQHYTFGRLTPVTTTTGANLFFTHDATAAGRKLPEDMSASEKAIKANAAFTSAVTGSAITDTSNVTTVASPYQAWAQPNSVYGTAESGIATKDEKGGGYYVDIPVWFRTSVTTGNVNLAVIATITPGPDLPDGTAGSTASDPDIYKAARVSLIASNSATEGVIMHDDAKYYHATVSSTITQADAGYGATAGSTDADNVAKTISAFSNNAATWNKVDKVTQATTTNISDGIVSDGDTVVTIPAATANEITETNKYGTPVQYTLRVWLEGEDIDCWNQTAGQDFRIDLRFIRQDSARTDGSNQ